MRRVVVMGVGNILRQDEGVGVHALRLFAESGWMSGVDLVDGGTSVFDALSGWRQIDKLVVLDAVRAGREPGAIARMSLREVADRTGPALSVHEHGLLDALGSLRQAGLRVGEVVIYGVEPAETGWGTDLSSQVAASLPLLAARLREELGPEAMEEQPI